MLSLITTGSGVKPRYELKPMGGFERVALAPPLRRLRHPFYGVMWAWRRLEDVSVRAYADSEKCAKRSLRRLLANRAARFAQSPTATPSRRGSVPPVSPSGEIAMPCRPELSSLTSTS